MMSNIDYKAAYGDEYRSKVALHKALEAVLGALPAEELVLLAMNVKDSTAQSYVAEELRRKMAA